MIPFEIFILPFLLALSFIFSGFETAFITLSPWEIKKLSREKLIDFFIHYPSKVLSTILLANNFVNVGIAVIITSFFYRGILKGYAIEIGGALSFILILIFGEILPKTVSKAHPEIIFSNLYKMIYFLAKNLDPVIKVFEKISLFLASRTFKQKKISERLRNDIFLLTMVKEREGEIPVQLGRTLRSLLRIPRKDIKEVMKPRTELFALNIEMDLNELIKKFLASSFTRVPVYKESLDKIIGILHVKDIQRIRKKEDIIKYLRKPVIIPENTKITDLIKKMKEQNMPFAIVIDEFGGTSGFLTLYDIILEFLGETETEEKIAKNFIIVDARIRIDDLIERYLLELPEGKFETLNGFLLHLTGRIPETGEIIRYKDYQFEILEGTKKMIKKVKIYFLL